MTKTFLVLLLLLGFVGFHASKPIPYSEDSKLSETLFSLGASKPKHYVEDLNQELIETGKALLIEGRAKKPNGKMGKYISKYYNCLSCHNIEKEDPNPAISDPEARLDYAIANDLPFLQGTTFRGIVSRDSWYNNDYDKKYGELVAPARDDLEEAIQLCATQCAQGRLLEDWELKAILAYYWSIDYDLKELNLSEDEINQLNNLPKRGQNVKAIDLLRTKFFTASPAHFTKLPVNFEEGYGIKGDPNRGKEIYERSCQHCHRPNGESSTVFHNDFAFEFLNKTIPDAGMFGFYPLISKGTYAAPGHKPYMPNYSIERMSLKQVEDLRAYIELKANS